jgi:hypothetical protein
LITDIDGRISIKLLDVVTIEEKDVFSEDYQVGMPTYKLSTDEIINKVVILSDYQPGSDKFLRTQIFTEQESIDRLGEREHTMEFKGVYSSLDTGNVIPPNRAARILLRLAYPFGTIETTTFLAKYNNEIGDVVTFKNRFLPSPKGGADMNSLLEIVSKAPMNLAENALIKWKLVFTSFSFARFGFIGPSPLITSVLAQDHFTIDVDQIENFAVGYYIRLWDDSTQSYYADTKREITKINGNEIFVDSDFDTTLSTSIRIFFPAYEDCSVAQRDKWCAVCEDTNVFAVDGKDAFEIVI